MRILVVNWLDRLNPQAGGAEVHLHEIFSRISDAGHQVDLLVSGWQGCPSEESLDDLQVFRAGDRYTFPLHVRRAFRRRLAGGPYDVVVEDINKLPLFTPVWTRAPVVGIVPHLFGTTAFRQESWPIASVVWAAERLMPHVYGKTEMIVISDSTASDLEERGFSANRIHVSYPGIDHRVYHPAARRAKCEEPTVAYVGRLRRYKGIDVVLEAVRALRDEGLALNMLVVGQGDDAPRLRRVVDELELGNQVRFTGFVPEEEKVRILQSVWANVYPSPKEGWGISNIEAAACGTPTVASDSPGLRESVRAGLSGFLVPHSDARAWASTLRRLVEDSSLRRRLGETAVAHARRFTWEATAAETEDILRQAASC